MKSTLHETTVLSLPFTTMIPSKFTFCSYLLSGTFHIGPFQCSKRPNAYLGDPGVKVMMWVISARLNIALSLSQVPVGDHRCCLHTCLINAGLATSLLRHRVMHHFCHLLLYSCHVFTITSISFCDHHFLVFFHWWRRKIIMSQNVNLLRNQSESLDDSVQERWYFTLYGILPYLTHHAFYLRNT